jgi:hypothetical protein
VEYADLSRKKEHLCSVEIIQFLFVLVHMWHWETHGYRVVVRNQRRRLVICVLEEVRA